MADINVCTRCGKTRIVVKEWSEELHGSTITHTITACPDVECQKIVDEQLNSKKERLKALEEESQKRRANIRKKSEAV